MTSRTVVFLREPADAPSLPQNEVDAIEQGHFAFLHSMREAGHMVTAGPFRDRFDESLRGMCLYSTGLAETRALAAGDPAVKAGLLVVEVVNWLTPAGELFES